MNARCLEYYICVTLSLSLCFNGHFCSWAWVSGCQNVSPSGLELWITEVEVTTAKLQSHLKHQQNLHPAFYAVDALAVDRPIN